jgi:hypothetical protein
LKNHENGESRFFPYRVIEQRWTGIADLKGAVMNWNLRTDTQTNGNTLPVSGNDFPDALVPD